MTLETRCRNLLNDSENALAQLRSRAASKIKEKCFDDVYAQLADVRQLLASVDDRRRQVSADRISISQTTLAKIENLMPHHSAPANIDDDHADMTPAPITEQVVADNNSTKNRYIQPLSAMEFAAIAKYMRGSLTLEMVNSIVETLDRLMHEKMSLMRVDFRKLSKADKDRCIGWREQQIPETANRPFIMETELKAALTTKQVGQLRKVTPILRHCRRIVEIRQKGVARLATYQ